MLFLTRRTKTYIYFKTWFSASFQGTNVATVELLQKETRMSKVSQYVDRLRVRQEVDCTAFHCRLKERAQGQIFCLKETEKSAAGCVLCQNIGKYWNYPSPFINFHALLQSVIFSAIFLSPSALNSN